jgi:hypothetical protein
VQSGCSKGQAWVDVDRSLGRNMSAADVPFRALFLTDRVMMETMVVLSRR